MPLEAGAELLTDGPALNGNRKPVVEIAITADSELMTPRLDRRSVKGVNPTSTSSISPAHRSHFRYRYLPGPVSYQTGGFATAHCHDQLSLLIVTSFFNIKR